MLTQTIVCLLQLFVYLFVCLGILPVSRCLCSSHYFSYFFLPSFLAGVQPLVAGDPCKAPSR